MWQQWLNFILGLWVVLSSFIIAPGSMMMNFIVSGLVIAALALWGALQHNMTMMERDEQMHRHA